KVFFDRNANGLQDAPEYSPLDRKELQEPPIPNVQLMMEDGTVITTDQEGKFHIPGVRPGRHVLRLDERSLPEGSYLTTDKAVILNITPGLLTKVNFGVDLDYESYATEDNIYFNEEIKFVHDRTTPKPRLNVSTYESPVMVYNDVFVDTVEFRIFTNYAAFVNKWKLEIVDKDTKRLVRSFEGDQLNIFDPIYWKGLDSTGNHIDLDKRYEYFITIEDAKGNYDETTPKEIVFEEIADDEALDKYYENTKQIRLTEYPKWVKEENQKNNLSIQTILIDGETIQIDQKESPVRNVRIMQDGRVINDIPVMEKQGLTAKELLLKEKQKTTDSSPIDIILPKGDFEVVVQEREVDEAAPVPVLIDEPVEGVVSAGYDAPLDVKTYSKKVRVGEDYLFFVALGDAEIGYSFTEGNIEPVEHDDRFNGGYYSDGKLAYYLKGKIKGKYLVTSSFDSERNNKEIFKKIDEDTYYPVYGDESSVNYADTNTQGKLYLKLEWDKSEVLWGNYSIAFGDTEFAQFSRSLFGGKVDFETVSTTDYGEPRTKIVAFRAEAKQKSAHVEMLATGGSLYFMKHKDILQGSDKVRVEVRDKITGLVISSREMKEGSDYEMDYGSGRMLFWKPIPILVDAYSIISSELLDGNLVYVVADYEYEVEDKIDEANAGFRARQAFGDDVLVGATYVKESLATSDYTLRGTDITLHAGKDATVVAEYAESEAEVTGSFVSTDGGITYTEIATDEGSEGRAYGIKGDARLFNNLAIKTYYKWVENDFSSSASLTQKGKETIGLEAIYDLSEDTRVTFRHDIQSLIEDGSGVTQLQLGAYKTSTSLLQVVHQARRLKITGEYQRKVVEKRLDQFDNTEISDEDVLAIQADYDLVSDKLAVTLRQQVSVGDEQERQTTIGVTATPTETLKITATETLADSGTATRLGVEASVTEKLTLLGEYGIVTDAETGKVGSVASVGGKAKVSDVLELEGSVGMASDVPGLSVDRATTLALGGTTKISENTEVTTQFEVSDSNSGQKTKVAVGGASQVDDDTKVSTQLSMAGDGLGVDTRTMTITGDQQVDDTTRIQNSLSVTDSATGVKTTNFSFGTTKRINEEIELASVRTFGTSPDENKTGSKYSIIREKDGKRLEGSLTRSYLESDSAVTRSNIFGLSGEIDDRWALSGSYEKGEVQNLDGETTLRDALSIGIGYVKKDPEKGKVLESS
ncbi:MAG: hypothetical protein KC684_08780, partial [Candidatus Omnitrophica bacterium]|nr:hypothetical protein [Candidatus Omnitrophota bacterium]